MLVTGPPTLCSEEVQGTRGGEKTVLDMVRPKNRLDRVPFCHRSVIVARSLVCNLSYVHPRKTSLVPTYSGGYFTQDTVPSDKNRGVLLAVLHCNLSGLFRPILTLDDGLVYLRIVLEVRYPYIENSMLNTLVPVSNLYIV